MYKIFTLCITLMMGACQMQQSTPIPLISRQTLFGNPDKTQVRISPDGHSISYLAPQDGVMNVWVQKADLSAPPILLTHDTGRGIQSQRWAYDNNHILFIQDRNGDENWRLFSVNVKTREIKTLTDMKNIQVRILASSHKHPHELMIGLNNRTPQYHDVYKINIKSGHMDKIYENNKFAGFAIDDDFNLRFALAVDTNDGSVSFFQKKENDWILWKKSNAVDATVTTLLDFDKKGNSLYWIDGSNTDKGELKKTNLFNGQEEIIFTPQKATVGGTFFHPTENVLLMVEENYLRPTYVPLDNPVTSIKEDMKTLKTLHKGEVSITSTSLDFNKWLVGFVQDDGPVRYYLYDRPSQTAHYLFSNRKALEDLPLVPMHPVEIKARDGLTLVGYFSLPQQTDPHHTGRPDKPLPMVLVVHGGPEARDEWGYSAMAQWLANRGYAYLAVNYRGSAGFGKSFVAAGNGEFARKMHTDLLDAVNWAIKQKIADPTKIAILGGSYGGYATLVGLTMTPDVFACGIDIVGISNLETLMASIPPYWKPLISSWYAKVGNTNTPEGKALMRERSPIHYVDNITKPLLIGQGANDPRVKQAESDQIVAAMKQKKIPVEYVVYPDEGHGFVKPENKISFFALAEEFLGKVLEGHVEPMGQDAKGSSMLIQSKNE